MPKHSQRLHKRHALGAALVSTLAATAAQATENMNEVVVVGNQQEIIRTEDGTAMKMDVDLKDTSRSVVSVTKEFLDQAAIEDVDGAFNYVSSFRRNGAADRTFTARGVRTPISNIMIDGMRTLQGGEGGTGSRMPSTFNADSVTFLRGPAGLLYGSGSAGGMVNIVTKKPEAEKQTSIGVSSRSYVASDVGSFEQNGLTFNLDSTGAVNSDETVMYRVLASTAPDRDMFQHGRTEDENFLDLALTFKLSDKTSLTPRLEHRDQERTGGSSYGDGLVGEYSDPGDRDRYYGSRDDYGKFESQTLGLTLDHAFNDSWKARAVVRKNDSDSDAQDLYTSTSYDPRGDGYIDRKYVRSSGRDEYKAFDANIEGKFNTSGVKHHVIAGVSYLDSNVGFFRSFQNTDEALGMNLVNSANPNDQTVGTVPEWDIQYSDRQQQDTNIYLKDRITLGDVTLVAGLAHVKQEQEEIRSGTLYKDSYSETLWDLGAIYAVTEDVNVFANYSRSYDPVSARSAAQYGNGQSYKPVEGDNYEIGAKASLMNGKVVPGITLFRLERKNNTEYVRVDGAWQLEQKNGVGFVSEGVELDALIMPTPNWNMMVSYAYTDAANTSGEDKGIQADNTPRHSLAVWNSYRLSGDLNAFKLGLGLRHESKRADGDNTLPSYVEADLGVYYTKDNWDVSMVLRNAFDKVRTEDGANGDSIVLPNEPRSLNLSMNYSF